MPVVINGTTGIVSPKVNTLDLELDSKNVVERGSNANGEYVRFADGFSLELQHGAEGYSINGINVFAKNNGPSGARNLAAFFMSVGRWY